MWKRHHPGVTKTFFVNYLNMQILVGAKDPNISNSPLICMEVAKSLYIAFSDNNLSFSSKGFAFHPYNC